MFVVNSISPTTGRNDFIMYVQLKQRLSLSTHSGKDQKGLTSLNEYVCYHMLSKVFHTRDASVSSSGSKHRYWINFATSIIPSARYLLCNDCSLNKESFVVKKLGWTESFHINKIVKQVKNKIYCSS